MLLCVRRRGREEGEGERRVLFQTGKFVVQMYACPPILIPPTPELKHISGVARMPELLGHGVQAKVSGGMLPKGICAP